MSNKNGNTVINNDTQLSKTARSVSALILTHTKHPNFVVVVHSTERTAFIDKFLTDVQHMPEDDNNFGTQFRLSSPMAHGEYNMVITIQIWILMEAQEDFDILVS